MEDDFDYEYYSKTVSFQQSQVCLESNPMALHEDFYYSADESIENFEWSQVDYNGWASGMTGAFGGDTTKFEPVEVEGEIVDDFLGECRSSTFQKLKYLKNKDIEKKYLNDYEAGLFEDKMLLEVVLQLDPFKTISERVSTSVLDYLGDLGGFY